MQYEYLTNRLQLKVIDEQYSSALLNFQLEGKEAFEAVEAERINGYYTEAYQSQILRFEYNAFLTGTYMRYYFFDINDPHTIIGTVSFSNILRGPYQSCIIGYKLLPRFQKRGYATEAISRLITALFEEEGLHRIEAYTLPDNYASMGLLNRLGFKFECLAKSFIKLKNGYADHNRYYLINPRD